jgi:hypothetical protein
MSTDVTPVGVACICCSKLALLRMPYWLLYMNPVEVATTAGFSNRALYRSPLSLVSYLQCA